MFRFSPAVAVPLCIVLTLSACDPGADPGLLAPEATPSRLQEDGTNTDSNVFILPPIGTSYTATLMDTYTPTRVETCTLNLDAIPLPAELEDFTEADWEAAQGLDCRDPEIDPGFTWYERSTSWNGETFIALITNADGDAQHYQLNLKPGDELADEILRVKVFMQEIALTATGAEGSSEQRALVDIALNENSSLTSPLHGEVAGQNFAFKYTVEMELGDNFFAVVDCDGGLFTGTTAGVYFEPNTFDECDDPAQDGFSLIIQQEQFVTEPGEPCLPLGWAQDGPCYHWQLYLSDGTTFEPYVGTLDPPMLAIYCLAAETGEWTGWLSPSGSNEVFPTENTSTAGLFTPDCGALEVASQGIGGLLHGVRNSLARLIGLDPKPLYAANLGFGELVGSSTSLFGRTEGKEVVKESGDGQVGLVNSTLPLPLVAQAVTVPHIGEEPESLPGEEVTFEVTGGGGFLTDDDGNTGTMLTVTADANGFVQVWWTLGPEPSPPDQTVDVYGDGFGFVDENNVFQERRTYSATAFQLVTDFREPLSASDAVSGDPHTLYEPDVWICPAPTAQPCTNPVAQFDASELKKTEDNGRWFFQVNWKPRDSGIAQGVFTVQVLVGNAVVGESVEIVVDKGGKVELIDDQLLINPTTDLPIKFTISQITQ